MNRAELTKLVAKVKAEFTRHYPTTLAVVVAYNWYEGFSTTNSEVIKLRNTKNSFNELLTVAHAECMRTEATYTQDNLAYRSYLEECFGIRLVYTRGGAIYPHNISGKLAFSTDWVLIEDAITSRNFSFNPGTNEWVRIADSPPRRADNKVKIYEHNKNPLDIVGFKMLPYEKAGNYEESLVYYGVELEVDTKKDNLEIAAKVYDDLGTDFVILKKDGSIGRNADGSAKGFEIVSAPATLAFHAKAWNKFFANSAKECSSWTTNTCGMHVHISRKAFTSPVHLVKMMALYNHPNNKKYIETIAGRDVGQWAKVNPKHNPFLSRLLDSKAEVNKTFPLQCSLKPENNRDKYSAVNLMKPETVEIRIFKGNTSKVGFFKNLEFVDAMFEYAKLIRFSKLSAGEEKMQAMRIKNNAKGEEMNYYGVDFDGFFRWLEYDKSARYNNLKLWLSKSKLLKDIKQKKVTDKTPKDKIISDADITAVA